MTKLKMILPLLIPLLVLCGCGVAPDSQGESADNQTASTSEPLIVQLVEHVRPDALQMVAPKGLLSEDPARPTPLLTQSTVVIPGSGKTCAGSFVGGLGNYSTTVPRAR